MTRFIARAVLMLTCCALLAEPYRYADVSSDELNSALEKLSGPSAAVSTATELYSIPPATSGKLSCSPNIASVSHLPSLSSDHSRPQVLVSGEIHGDERVGPGASLVLAQLLVWAAQCEVQHDMAACTQLEDMGGVTKAQRTWLALLATRRETLVVPAANCLGYSTRQRRDAGVDPNRDFAYARRDGRCFRSTTARILRALMQRSIVQVVVTFHGGMVALGYEWGSRNHVRPRDRSPDNAAHVDIAQRMKLFAGSFLGEKAYPVGPINSLIYPVDGGMEDWLYAAGWDQPSLRKCDGDDAGAVGEAGVKGGLAMTHAQGGRKKRGARSLRGEDLNSLPDSGGLGQGAVQADGTGRGLAEGAGVGVAENRALVFLVETSDKKTPSPASLGGSLGILDPSSPESGHVPRNARLGLAAVDLAQPYVCFSAITGGNTSSSSSDSSGSGMVSLDLQWYVGGATVVDSTFLALHPIPESGGLEKLADWTSYLETLPAPHLGDAHTASEQRGAGGAGEAVFVSERVSGSSRWVGKETTSTSTSTAGVGAGVGAVADFAPDDPMRPLSSFSSPFAPTAPGRYWLVAWAKVDQHFGSVSSTPSVSTSTTTPASGGSSQVEKGQGYPAELGPQSHLAQLRTDSSWSRQVGDRKTQGRLLWPSDPIQVMVQEQGGVLRVTVESAVRHCAWWTRPGIPKSSESGVKARTRQASAEPSQPPYASHAILNSFSWDSWAPGVLGVQGELALAAALLLLVALGLSLLASCLNFLTRSQAGADKHSEDQTEGGGGGRQRRARTSALCKGRSRALTPRHIGT